MLLPAAVFMAGNRPHGGRERLCTGCKSLFLLLVYRLCGALAGPIIVDSHVTAVWGKNVTLKCIIDMNETITQISWEKLVGKYTQTVAVHHPHYGVSFQGKYQGRTTFKNYSFSDATIVINNIDFSDAGEYICKAVTFPLGNAQASTSVTILVEPTVTLTRGQSPLIDGDNETVAAVCTAANGKPAARIHWEGNLGTTESNSISFPNETVTVVSHYKVIPTRFARGRRITCVVQHPALEKEIRYPYMLDIHYEPEVSVTGYDGNWFVGRENVQLKCNADANPSPTEFIWTRLDGQWPDGLSSLNNTLHFTSPLTHNYSGIYVCKVVNAMGQRSDQKNIYILDPTTTTPPPTVPEPHSTAGITGLATAFKNVHVPASTLATVQDDYLGTVIGSAVGGALFMILVVILAGIVCYRRKRTFRGDYFTKNYIPPSDMQKESQIDVLQPEDLDPYPDSVKKEVKHPVNNVIGYREYIEDEKPDWNNIDSYNHRYQEQFGRPVDYYEGKTMPVGLKYIREDCYDENEDDLVSHLDGSVISRREWYV